MKKNTNTGAELTLGRRYRATTPLKAKMTNSSGMWTVHLPAGSVGVVCRINALSYTLAFPRVDYTGAATIYTCRISNRQAHLFKSA